MRIDDLLKLFTSKDDDKPAMQKPCLIGEYVYATDAHCLIKAPVKNLKEIYKEVPKFPDCEGVITGAALLEEPLIIKVDLLNDVLSSIPIVDKFQECPYCEGEGERECDLGHMHDCEECKEGLTNRVVGKMYKQFSLVKINDCYYHPKYIKLISQACEAHEVDFLTAIAMLPGRAMVAKIKDSIVLIMPVIYDKTEHTEYDIYQEKITQKVDK